MLLANSVRQKGFIENSVFFIYTIKIKYWWLLKFTNNNDSSDLQLF